MVDLCNIGQILKIAGAHNWKKISGNFVRSSKNICRTKCPSAKNIYFKACNPGYNKMIFKEGNIFTSVHDQKKS